MAHPEITRRDLRNRSKEITREEFSAMSRDAPSIDLTVFRADQDAALDHGTDSAYER